MDFHRNIVKVVMDFASCSSLAKPTHSNPLLCNIFILVLLANLLEIKGQEIQGQ